MGLVDKLFGSYSAKELKRIRPQVDAVLALEDHYRQMDNKTLQGETARFKELLANGKNLDDILPEAFAACREAADRVLGMRHFPVQVMGGIILHQGRIAEMKTGEGKTLVATLPAYLNALSGKGVHVVTVNEYLARRDSEWMGNLYRWMGLTVGLAISGMSPDEKRAAYAADITYGTNNEFGFDYLRDNMVVYKRNCVQRGWNYAIVDEVDSILIDEARTPLIISGAGEKSTDLYEKADRFAATLTPLRVKEMDAKDDQEDIQADYIVDEKARTATITPQGARKAEQYFGIESLNDPENLTLAHHINQAIAARGVNANLLIGVGEQIVITRPNLFGPLPQELCDIVYPSLAYRLMAHSAEDLCEYAMTQEQMLACSHGDIRHGFVLEFSEHQPDIDIPTLEARVNELIRQDLPIDYYDESHILLGGAQHYCTGPRTHVRSTGRIIGFRLLDHFIYDHFHKTYMLVGCVGDDSEENIRKLETIHG